MKLLSWLVFFLLFVCRNQVEGQQICIEKYKPAIDHELFFTLYALETDSNGYVYLATDNGIFVYNGSVVEKQQSDFNTGDIINLYKDTKERIWALPYNGKIHLINANNNRNFELNFFGDNAFTVAAVPFIQCYFYSSR